MVLVRELRHTGPTAFFAAWNTTSQVLFSAAGRPQDKRASWQIYRTSKSRPTTLPPQWPSTVRVEAPSAVQLNTVLKITLAGLEESWRNKLPQHPVWLSGDEGRQFLWGLLGAQPSVSVGYVYSSMDVHDTNDVTLARAKAYGQLDELSNGRRVQRTPFPMAAGDFLVASRDTGLRFYAKASGWHPALLESGTHITARALLANLGLATAGLEERGVEQFMVAATAIQPVISWPDSPAPPFQHVMHLGEEGDRLARYFGLRPASSAFRNTVLFESALGPMTGMGGPFLRSPFSKSRDGR